MLSWLNLYSATADLSGCPTHMCRLCACFSCLNGNTSQSNVHLATHTGDVVHSRSPQVVLHRTVEAGDLPRWKSNTLDVCQVNIQLRLQYVFWAYGKTATEVGFSFCLEVLTVGLRAHRICLRLCPFPLKAVFRNSKSSLMVSLSQSPGRDTKVARTTCLLERR